MDLRCYIVEDEVGPRKVLEALLDFHCPDAEIVGWSETVSKAASEIPTEQPNLLFLDIDLQDCSAFDLLDRLSDEPNLDCSIIFTTGLDKFAVKAFRYAAVDYLLKPLDPVDLLAAVKKVHKRGEQDRLRDRLDYLNELIRQDRSERVERLCVKGEDGIDFVQISKIIRCASDKNYTLIHTADSRLIVATKPLKDFEELLPDSDFMRVHQSHLINLRQVLRFDREDGGFIVMEDGSKVPLSRRRKAAFLERMTS